MKRLLLGIALGALSLGLAEAAPSGTIQASMAVCDPNAPTGCMQPNGTPTHVLSGASTNSTLVKGAPGQITSIVVVNTTATVYYLKLYDKATAPTCAADTVVQTYPIPANAASAGAGIVVSLPMGMGFANGIGLCLTGGIADNDNTNAATGVAINVVYK